ncbi:DUF4197 domain-containing protein [Aquabacterium sp.]|uniref:DUF4197 domain-containing protein n=1 Tax=Aquabacterium sp. TaxID=1872578 RepID=UPI0035B3FF04
MKIDRRALVRAAPAGWMLAALPGAAWALDLSQVDALAGLREALGRGAQAAVASLGKADGFMGNPQVHIPLPASLKKVESLMRAMGQGKRLDELELALNRAAESAVPLAQPLLADAIKSMTVDDARKVLAGGDTSVTDFFAGKTRAPLTERFLPIVRQTTDKAALARKYNDVAGRARQFGFVKEQDADVATYVTGKALDGLFLMIGEEERQIRRDPVGTGSKLLQKVFGSL